MATWRQRFEKLDPRRSRANGGRIAVDAVLAESSRDTSAKTERLANATPEEIIAEIVTAIKNHYPPYQKADEGNNGLVRWGYEDGVKKIFRIKYSTDVEMMTTQTDTIEDPEGPTPVVHRIYTTWGAHITDVTPQHSEPQIIGPDSSMYLPILRALYRQVDYYVPQTE